MALGLFTSVLGASIVLFELLFRSYGREVGFSERDGGGCLTIVGLIPMVVGGYLLGAVGVVVAIIGMLLATKARSRGGMALSVVGLITSLLGVGATALMHVDVKNW